jgi:transcriptional regulator with XRE-family HTH domain
MGNKYVKIYDYGGKKNICGDRIREARVVQRMSQSELAAKMQIAGIAIERDSISRIENGTRFVADYELKIFAEVLNVDIVWLLAGIEETS